MKIFLLFLLIYFNFYSYSQSDYIKFIEDQYNGGVCFVGTNITYPFINLDIPIFIEPNSTIKSAFLIVNSKNKIDSTITIKINNFNFTSNQIATTNLINDSKSYTGGNWSMNHISIIECKDAIINLNNINIIVPEQQPSNPHALFDLFYFYIEYENPNLPLINTCLIFNEEDIWVPMEYTLNQHNKMDTTKDISLSVLTTDICGDWDAYKIMVNNDSIGLIYGKDNINQSFCQGVGGHFYHQNETTYGLDDDSPDAFMDSSDALANIRQYITNPNSFGLDFIYHTGISPGGVQTQNFPDGLTNSINAFVLAYTPDCDATGLTVGFTDTTICKGESINLNASGGVRYVWEPNTYLSDSTVANPICTAQQPTWYTCTMYTADTCSKTIPVFVDVLTPPTLSITTTPDTCGYNTGSIINSAQGVSPLNLALNGGTSQTDSVFTNLSNGNYSVMVTDGNGCSTAQNATVENINITQALFTATPNIGTAPTEVEFVNQSTDATNAQWYILEDTFYTQNANYTFTDTGLYNMMLIAYNNTLNCSDTTYGTVQIVPPLFINIPNVITPNNDQINDIFSIDIEGAKAIHCTIFNRWGNQLFTYEEPVTPYLQTLNIWDAVTADNSIYSDGTYFYVIYVVTPTNLRQSYTGTIQVFGE